MVVKGWREVRGEGRCQFGPEPVRVPPRRREAWGPMKVDVVGERAGDGDARDVRCC